MNQFDQISKSSGISGSRDIPPALPTPSEKANETLGYLREIDVVMSDLRRMLYGFFPDSATNEPKRADEPCLDERLTEICQRAACISGELKSILGRL